LASIWTWDSMSSWLCNAIPDTTRCFRFLSIRSLSLFLSLLKRKSNPEFSRYHNNSRARLQNHKAQVLQGPPGPGHHEGPFLLLVLRIRRRSATNLHHFGNPAGTKERRNEATSSPPSGSGAEQPTPLLVRRRLPGPWPWPPPPPGCSGRPAPPPTSGSPPSPGPSPPVRPPPLSPAPWFLGSRLLAVGTAPPCVVSRAYKSRLAVGTVPDLGRGSALHQTAHTFRDGGFTTGFSRRRSLLTACV
jgi:hypothetical protein